MNKIKRCLLVVALTCIASTSSINATENHGVDKKEEAVGFFCKLFPMVCDIRSSGNGGGKEPPIG